MSRSDQLELYSVVRVHVASWLLGAGNVLYCVYAAARVSCPASPEHLKVSSRRRTEAPRNVIITIICIREAVEREYKKASGSPG